MADQGNSANKEWQSLSKRATLVTVALFLTMACVGLVVLTQGHSAPSVLMYIDAQGESQHVDITKVISPEKQAAAKRIAQIGVSQHALAAPTKNDESRIDAPILDALEEHQQDEQTSEHLLRLSHEAKHPNKEKTWHDEKWDKDLLHAMPSHKGTKLESASQWYERIMGEADHSKSDQSELKNKKVNLRLQKKGSVFTGGL